MSNETAFKVFKLSAIGYCCTQIMLKMALDDEDTVNEDLIRSVNGLCNGIAGRQKTCGILIGGIMILGLYAGRGKDEEYYKENYGDMVHEFTDWFEEEFESIDCVDLIGVNKFDDGENSYMIKCGNIIEKSYEKVIELLTENGYEFGIRENE
ncbi:C_GCAxxG_C_C family probable redox protein [Alkalibaculum bacchi]|uniref:C_GCAxxG_C_C family probable redox protein n=1 Tax=Alkalibaculum bacchi TaxID=645887 RepID=A0A366IAG1_9FIRM|nr:DV_1555 family C-GCAxxG-C-C protein [Alkalibaculum bacchi]RBP66014.1 C_GCAxxG_C_C family probable redox protein [Alkalibaculum bacchi]